MAQNNEIIANFLPITQNFDAQDVRNMDIGSKEYKDLIVGLYQSVNRSSNSINDKVIGLYDTQEYACGKVYFSAPTSGGASSSATTPYLRPVYRKVIVFGALPNAASTTIAHGITVTSGLFFTRIVGTANDPIAKKQLPLPYASTTLVNSIELYIDDGNIVIVTGIDRTMYTQTEIVLEYLKE